jgi:catechol 2,3-dioxygenase-like lactoylglutathione lyase family enzyme
LRQRVFLTMIPPMSLTLDHFAIAVADLEAATARYAALLGRAPSWRGRHPAFGTSNTLFRLDNTYVELLAARPDAATPLAEMVRGTLRERVERPFMLAIRAGDLDVTVARLRRDGIDVSAPMDGEGLDDRNNRRTWRNAVIDPRTAGGLRLLLIEHTSTETLLPAAPALADDAAACRGVDHLVVFTSDLDGAVRWWCDHLGAREHWRREFPERGTVNAGMVLGGLTIECVMRTPATAGPRRDHFWGVAYEVRNLAAAVARARRAGLTLDDPRPGLAPGTQVATVRWDGTPTLLLAYDSAATRARLRPAGAE